MLLVDASGLDGGRFWITTLAVLAARRMMEKDNGLRTNGDILSHLKDALIIRAGIA